MSKSLRPGQNTRSGGYGFGGPGNAGVKTDEIRKGRVLMGLRDICRVLLEILPLQKSKENRGKA